MRTYNNTAVLLVYYHVYRNLGYSNREAMQLADEGRLVTLLIRDLHQTLKHLYYVDDADVIDDDEYNYYTTGYMPRW